MEFKPSNYPNYSSDRWALSYIRDELIYQLSSANLVEIDKETNVIHITHKYYDLAEFVLYRINLWNPAIPPVFIINTSDLTPSLYIELERLKVSSSHQFEKVVTEAVQALLEGINKRYYHIAGLPYKVTWRLEL